MRNTTGLTRCAALAASVSAVLLAHMQPVRADSSELVLVRDGKALATIVTTAKPGDNVKEAAADLQKYIEKMSGARLPIATDAAAPTGTTLILLGHSALTDRIPDLQIPSGRTKALREEGFIIKTLPGRLVLAGNDDEVYLGTRYAVVELLHSLGVRWFLPGEKGEVVPKMSTIAIKPMDLRQRPDFALRDYWEHAEGNMAAEAREWKIHNKMSPELAQHVGIPGDSSIGGLLPKDQFKDHPDWFALQRDGTRSIGHPCTTSEGMINAFVERIKADARKGAKLMAFSPDDGMPRCWCDKCTKLGNSFDGYGANDRDPVPESSISNEWFYFCNQIMNEVNREFPDFLLAVNGYANRDIPPELPPDVEWNPRKNLVVMFANICACTIHAYDDPKCWQMKRQGQMIRQWCKLSDKVWMYNYNYTMLVNKGTLTPMVHRIRRNIPLLKEWGIIGFSDQDEADLGLCGIPTRLVRARLEWDTKADVDAVLDDFFEKWFGPAAAPMKAYYDALEAAFESAPQHGHEDVILNAIYTEALMAKLDALIKEAHARPLNDQQRYAMQIERAIYDYLCAYVAMEKAKREGDLAEAVRKVKWMVQARAEMRRLTPFLGYYPYPCYGIEWELKRLEETAAKVSGKDGELVAWVPATARFRTDPFDDGRFERWQDLPAEQGPWRDMTATMGWDAQGLHDEHGHPYRGVAWYQFNVDVPESARGKDVFLHGMALVNEAWVWVNGQYAGHRPYMMPWFRPHQLEMDVSGLLRPGQPNRVTVRVLCNFDVWGANGIYERMFLYAKKPAVSPQAAR